MKKWDNEDIEKLRNLYQDHGPKAIAERLGLTRGQVVGMLYRSGLRANGGRPKGGGRGQLKDGDLATRKKWPIPLWVPPKMHEDYCIVASLEGEHAAAKWAREEKRAS
jgi:hypothetical protein